MTTTETNVSHNYLQAGAYDVMLVSMNDNCNVQDSTVKTIFIKGETVLNTNALNKAFNIYPNPVKDVLNIQTVALEENIQSIDILNMLGQKIKSFNSIKSQNTFDVADLVPGIYNVEIHSDKNSYSYKFNKE